MDAIKKKTERANKIRLKKIKHQGEEDDDISYSSSSSMSSDPDISKLERITLSQGGQRRKSYKIQNSMDSHGHCHKESRSKNRSLVKQISFVDNIQEVIDQK